MPQRYQLGYDSQDCNQRGICPRICNSPHTGKEFTGPIMAQEVGHLFGLEPRESPHFEDPRDPSHSKDPAHNDPFAFDFYLLKPYQPPPGGFVGDVMNNLAGGVWQGRDMVLYNAFDWEYLRQKLIKLPGSSRAIIDAKRPSKGQQRKLVEELTKMFDGEARINVRKPEMALSSKRGFAWHWTSLGFQSVAKTQDRSLDWLLALKRFGLRLMILASMKFTLR